MKQIFTVAFCCFSFIVHAQFSTSFESGNLNSWIQTPESHWGASSVSALSGNYSLKHVFTGAAGTSVIYHPLSGIPVDNGITQWRFLLRHGFNPSGTNRWAVFLFSNNAGSEWKSGGIYEGYAIGVNMATPTSSDTLTLYAVRNNSFTIVRKTTVNWEKDITTTGVGAIEVIRNSDGEWLIKAATTGNFGDLQPVAEPVTHNSYGAANYFGISYQYTITAATLLWIDDISVVFERVIVPARIRSVAQQGQDKIRVAFTQNVNAATVGAVANYQLIHASSTLSPVLAEVVNDKEILLTFENPLPRGNAMLSVKTLLDENNNEVIDEAAVAIFYLLYGDVVINEIMAAPAPSAGLPEVSYIELYNRLDLPVPLSGWKMEYGTTVGNIGAATLPANGFLILCTSAAVEDMRVYGNVTNVSYISSLTKSGKALQLKNNDGLLLARVAYSDRWFNDEAKRAGGWSLEKIDVNNLSESASNWAESMDVRGGTPGTANSVQAQRPDTEAPFVTDLKMTDDKTLFLIFNELFDTAKALNELCYILNNGAGHPQQVIIGADNPLQVTLQFASPFEPGMVYALRLSAPFCDLAGNVPDDLPYSFGNLFLPKANDIVINEALFNPPVNGVDFVEIYNRSDEIFDLRQLQLATRNKDSNVAAIQNIAQQYYLRPREYAVFTTSLEAVQQFYAVPFPEKVIILKDLPSYPNESGCIVLLNEHDDVIDEFVYSEKMHSGFINNPKGISLERVNPDRPASESANWQSAAQDAGFATPTYRNSQYNTREERPAGAFSLPCEVFSPDGDGYNDVLYIDYNVGASGYVATISIYDTQGRLVKEVEKNALLGVSGRFAWDGTRHDSRKAGAGMYIIFIEYFDLNGKVSHLKKACALAAR
ncbi:MAG: lamin tail domain-containing protein [Prevotellaceae bacterium]|jgi:hypothetical protein|nr:lamin tail domain-containing protein [Prevotellaceae bacterium]